MNYTEIARIKMKNALIPIVGELVRLSCPPKYKETCILFLPAPQTNVFQKIKDDKLKEKILVNILNLTHIYNMIHNS